MTFSPALDYVIFADDVKFGAVNRINREIVQVGGKGINVSIVLAELGIESKAMGFIAGFTGSAIEEGVKAYGIESDFVRLPEGLSRINIKLKSNGETDLNAQGPHIPDSALKEMFERLGELCDGDVLVLAGSVPDTLPRNIYEQILEYISAKKVRVIVDAAKELLTNTLKYKPFLIKPNMEELEEIFGEKPNSLEEAAVWAEHLRDMGAQNVIVSMADKGALLLDSEGKTYYSKACEGKVRSSVGAGEAMIAGFIAGMLDNDVDNEYALLLGTAAGGATAFSDRLASKSEIIKQLKKLLINRENG